MTSTPPASPEREYLKVARKLIRGTDNHKYDPFTRVTYQDTLNSDRWQFPEDLISLYHHPLYNELSDAQKWQLALEEGLHFFSFNIHGEQALVTEMEPRLYRDKRAGEDPVSSTYLQRFIHEENAHTYMLAGYCVRYGGAVKRDRNFVVQVPKLSIEAEDALYYGRIWVLENYLGYVNKIAFDHPDLDRTAQDIHRFHHHDEARHKAWDKAMLEENVLRIQRAADESGQPCSELAELRRLLDAYIDYVCTASTDPGPYRTLKLENIPALRQAVQKLPARQAQHARWIDPVRRYFDKIGLTDAAAKT
ncbi:MAG: diiron oxygenase [Pseudomonadota bacterium]